MPRVPTKSQRKRRARLVAERIVEGRIVGGDGCSDPTGCGCSSESVEEEGRRTRNASARRERCERLAVRRGTEEGFANEIARGSMQATAPAVEEQDVTVFRVRVGSVAHCKPCG